MTLSLPIEIWDEILVKTGDLELAILYKNNYVINKIFNKDKHTFYWCIMHDNLVVFDFLVKKREGLEHPEYKAIFVDAIWFNNFRIAEYIINNELMDMDDPNIEDTIYNCCVYRTNLDTILFFERYNIELTNYLVDEICGNCDVLTLMYLLGKGYRFSQIGIINTVRNGNIANLDILLSRDDIAYDNEYTVPIYLMDTACENYRFEMMRHLYNKYNIYGSEYILEKAALTRSKQTIKWVYKTHNYVSITSFCRVILLNYFSEQELLEIGIDININ